MTTNAAPDERFALIELDPIPAKAPRAPDPIKPVTPQDPHAPLVQRLIGAVNACPDMTALENIGAAFNARTTPDGRLFQSLPKPKQEPIRIAWRNRRAAITCVALWALIWRSFCQGVERGTQLQEYIIERRSVPPVASIVPPTQTPTVAPPSAPSSNGTIVDILRQVSQETRRPAMRATQRVNDARPVPGPRRVLVTPGELVAVSLRQGQGVLVSWTRARAVRAGARVASASHDAVIRALNSIGRVDIAPDAKSNHAQFGRAMQILNSNGLVARAADRPGATEAQWPSDVVSRWVVGTLDTTGSSSLGDKELIADLTRAGTIRFQGRQDLADRVSADYTARTRDDLYTQTDLADWFEGVLRKYHYATTCGAHLYIAGGEVDRVRELVTAVRPLMARSIQLITVARPEDVTEGIAEGLADEAMALRARFDKNTARAIEERRTGITAGSAGKMLDETADLRRRIDAFEAFVPADMMTPAKDALLMLEESLRARMDESEARYAAIELS